MARRRGRLCAVLLALTTGFLAGCGGGGGGQTRLRVVQASPDEPSLQVLVDTKNVASNLALGNSTGYLKVSSGSRQVEVRSTDSTDSSDDVINQTLSLSDGTDTTMLVANFAASVTAIVLTDDNAAPASGDFKMRLINAAPNLGPVDIYVLPQGTDINSVSPTVSSLAFGAASEYQSLTAGTYEVFFVVPGTKLAFIDTGALTLASGQVRTMLALNTSDNGYTFTTFNDVN